MKLKKKKKWKTYENEIGQKVEGGNVIYPKSKIKLLRSHANANQKCVEYEVSNIYITFYSYFNLNAFPYAQPYPVVLKSLN